MCSHSTFVNDGLTVLWFELCFYECCHSRFNDVIIFFSKWFVSLEISKYIRAESIKIMSAVTAAALALNAAASAAS